MILEKLANDKKQSSMINETTLANLTGNLSKTIVDCSVILKRIDPNSTRKSQAIHEESNITSRNSSVSNSSKALLNGF